MRLNIYIGAFALNAVVLTLITFSSDMIFREHAQSQMGYKIEAIDLATVPSPRVVGFIEPVEPLMETADTAKGERFFKRCLACHTTSATGYHKVGPKLWNIVGRQPGTQADFRYSSAMTTFGIQYGPWTIRNLNLYLADPNKLIKGTITGQLPVHKAIDRANLIAYLMAQSPVTQPLK